MKPRIAHLWHFQGRPPSWVDLARPSSKLAAQRKDVLARERPRRDDDSKDGLETA